MYVGMHILIIDLYLLDCKLMNCGRLDSNALICDCRVIWLQRMLKDKQSTTQVAATCDQPELLHGQSLVSISEADFHCKKPSFTEEPDDVDVNFGGTSYFRCKADGDPHPDIVWFRDSNEINFQDDDLDKRYSLLNDGTTLMIENTQDSDEGVYECMAKNVIGEVKSRRVQMAKRHVTEKSHRTDHFQQHNKKPPKFESGAAKPRFQEYPQGQEVVLGGSAELRCKATGSPQPQVTWTRASQPISTDLRYQVSTGGTLSISNIQSQDGGVYRCTAINYLGSITAVAQIVVQEPPQISERPQDQKVSEGRFVEFICKAEGTPQPHLIWRKDGRTIVADARIIIDFFGTTLRISSVRKSDEGLYECRAQNIVGIVSSQARLTVKAKIAPTFRHIPRDMAVSEGSNVQFLCNAEGDPAPIVAWIKDGRVLSDNSRRRIGADGTLYIYNVDKDDEGRYDCAADNGIGYITTFVHLKIKADSDHPGDKFVQIAFEEASRNVDRAYNDTLRNLYAKDKVYTPAELLRLFRFPSQSAQHLARAAEIYERTLLIIKRHVESGAKFNLSEFSYHDVLSPSHLEMIANLSGCLVHRRVVDCGDMCFHGRYRTFDGTCNNLQHPMWAASETPFLRILQPIYENGFNIPVAWSDNLYHGHPKPSPRLVSMQVISTDEITPDDEYSHMLMQWGQFLDHDLDLAPPTISSERFVDGEDCSQSCDNSPPCFPIQIPSSDPRSLSQRCMEFTRSSAICGSGSTSLLFENVMPREQINVLTSFVDASQVSIINHFSLEVESIGLHPIRSLLGYSRAHIQLKLVFNNTDFGGKPLMPFSDNWPIDCRRDPRESNIGCFLGGDIRVNEQLGLAAIHTLFFREHNRIAETLRSLNTHWDSDMLFHETRKIIGAQMQHITYKHWLPKIFGPKGMHMLGPYQGYDPNVDSSISNSFATAAMRFGHTLINPIFHRLNASYEPIPQGHLPLSKAFFSPFRLVEEGGVDPLVRGLFVMPAKLRKSDQLLNKELTEQLFRQVHAVALDLAAINIQRGRDHALPGYNEWRRFCNLTYAHSFHDLRHEIRSHELREKLRELYGHPSNIDLWVAGVSEDLVPGARVGPTFLCILVDQFRRLRSGDRFFYENPGVFKPEQLVQIKQSSMSRIVCDNSDKIQEVTSDIFIIPQKHQPNFTSCNNVAPVDLRFWTECCHDCTRSGDFNSITRLTSNNRLRRELQFSYPGDKPFYTNVSLADSMLVEFKEAHVPLPNSIPLPHKIFSRGKMDLLSIGDEDVLEERVEGIEEVIVQLKKQLKQLKKKFKVLAVECRSSNNRSKQCRDSRGIERDHGEEWEMDSCSRCRCEDQQITCKVQTCPPLSCETPVLHENSCCPVC
uniref:Peroxidase n=1 Tax=Strigamia maritima TaxID=126957 RepID=T1IXZ7_STRMM